MSVSNSFSAVIIEDVFSFFSAKRDGHVIMMFSSEWLLEVIPIGREQWQLHLFRVNWAPPTALLCCVGPTFLCVQWVALISQRVKFGDGTKADRAIWTDF